MSWTRSQIRVRGAGGSDRPSGSRRTWPPSPTGCPASFTGRPMSSIGCPSLARSGKPWESIRGRPVGCGHEPVVKVWPQKWNASDSPGSISVPTVRAAVSAIRAPPTRARKPRREVSRASESAIRSRCSGTALGGRQDALQLGEVVEGPLGQDLAGCIESDRERAARDLEVAPGLRLGHLVELHDRHSGVVADALDGRSERLADVAALRGEHGKAKALRMAAVETEALREPLDPGSHLGPLSLDLERSLGPE